MFFSKCTPNVVLGIEGTLAHVAQNFQMTLTHSSLGIAAFSSPIVHFLKCNGLCKTSVGMGSHFQTWHHRSILVGGWKWATSNSEHEALCGNTEEVLGIIGKTQRNGSRSTVVPARRSHPPHIKCLPSLTYKAIWWQTDQQEVWCWVGSAFTRPEPPRFLSVGVSQRQCVWE